LIHASGLARSFRTRRGTVEAVCGVDIHVASGELVGFLGPNGAGKTTTLRMLTTLLAPTAGTATVAGCDLLSDPVGVRRRIGYVGQAGGAGPDCPVLDELVLQGRLYGMPAQRAHVRGRELLGQLELTGTERRLAGTLSGGQRRRLDIAMGLVHVPGLLFLDEPTTGLDPQSRANLWQHIRALHEEKGITVFLTTHYLDEADALCDRILVIDNGHIVAEGSPDELKRTLAGDTVELGTDTPGHTAQLAQAVPGTTGLAVEGATVRFRVPRASTALPVLLRQLDAAGIALESIEVHRPTLDDVFLTLTGRSLRDAGSGAPDAVEHPEPALPVI
jgi:ABC-2 type transport system ATP-binding protein